MTEKILKATHEGDLKIGGISIPCSVLEGGIRVLSRRGVNTALGGSTGGVEAKTIGGRNLPRILGTKAVLTHISSELMAGMEKTFSDPRVEWLMSQKEKPDEMDLFRPNSPFMKNGEWK